MSGVLVKVMNEQLKLLGGWRQNYIEMMNNYNMNEL